MIDVSKTMYLCEQLNIIINYGIFCSNTISQNLQKSFMYDWLMNNHSLPKECIFKLLPIENRLYGFIFINKEPVLRFAFDDEKVFLKDYHLKIPVQQDHGTTNGFMILEYNVLLKLF